MAFSTSNEFAAAAKKQLESQQAVWAALTSNTLDNVRKLIELNIKVMKESMGDSAAAANKLLAAKTPQEFLSLSAAQSKPNIEKVLAYGRQVAGITSNIQSELGKAVQTQIHESSHRVTPVVVQLAKSAPADSENAYAVMKAALEKTNAGYEQWMKMTQQAAKQIETKMTDAATEFVEAATKVPSIVAIAEKKVASPPKETPVPAMKAAAPAKKTAAPAKKTASPAKKTATPAKKAASPEKKTVASKKAVK